MAEDVKPCCGQPFEAHCPWHCPLTPIWADTIADIRPGDCGHAVWALKNLPIHVINRPDLSLDIDPDDASWTITDRTKAPLGYA